MKKVLFTLAVAGVVLSSCGGKETPSTENEITKTEAPALEAEEVVTEEAAPAKEASSSDPMKNKGIGPVTSVTLAPEVDMAMAKKGEEIYTAKCTACHKPDKKFIGPAPKDILERRSPEWVMNMILNPEVMIKEDPIAKQLLVEANGAPMANQSLTEQQAREVLEYFRTIK